MDNKQKTLFKGLKLLAFALPFLFIAPIVITIGFKALAKDNVYYILFLGLILALVAMSLTILGIKTLLNSFFDK